MTSRRLPEGGSLIDRSRLLRFTFDGVEYEGFQGDSLASSLLANGVTGGFTSPILGRPRGVFSAGVEEPNAFVEIREPWVDPIVAATTVPVVDGMVTTPRAGVGRLDTNPVPAAEHRHIHVEAVVVGAGDFGQAAARVAARGGDRVLLVEQSPAPELSIEGVVVLQSSTALGLYDDGYLVVHEEASPSRVWHIRARHVVLATGAHERPIAFVGNDLPGVMLAGAAAAYVERFGVLAGEHVVVITTNDSTNAVEDTLRAARAEVTLVDARRDEAIASARGEGRVESVRTTEGRELPCDLLLVSGGWNPAVQLWRSIGGGMRYDERLAAFVPDGTGPSWLRVVGSAAGDQLPVVHPLWRVSDGNDAEKFVDLQRDQTVADVTSALSAGLRSVEHVKRATYIGTAIDQGRTSGVIAAEIVNALAGADPGAQGPTGARPPYVPVSYSAFAGPYRGELLDPVRRTPMHSWHVEHGAVFEDVGQWKRPRYFPRNGESMDEAVARECLAVRNGVGVLDATTLGKIEVVGPDAAEFLDRMYTNRMSTLPVGRIRYGLMLGLDGMVVDDGVAMRLTEDRFLVFATTSGAALVMERFEEWLQTEWPELRVYCTSVTEQWAVVSVAGPRARDVVAATGTDIDLSPEAFPFMSFREGTVAGVPARVARVSFTGELSFEIDVNGWDGPAVWDAVITAGQTSGIAPYGTETMHVLRAEKGYVIVGQDTDGTVTPDDLGMSWLVRKDDSDFVGKRSLRRTDLVREDRKQLVGLLPERVLPEGAQIVAEHTGQIPMEMIGHVTSSYQSAALGRPIALAMVEAGRSLQGSKVFSPLAGGTIAAEVVSPVFYDPEGERLRG